MTWEGDVYQFLPADGKPEFHGGPSDPFRVAVTEIDFLGGNSAFVFGVVVNSPNKSDEGMIAFFTFTDNSGIGDPDEIDGVPIDAGRITVKFTDECETKVNDPSPRIQGFFESPASVG